MNRKDVECVCVVCAVAKAHVARICGYASSLLMKMQRSKYRYNWINERTRAIGSNKASATE